MTAKPLSHESETQSTPLRVWAVLLAAALLWHFFLLWLRPFPAVRTQPSRVEVQQIDPRKLEAIRRKWQDLPLLLNKDKSKPVPAEPPKNARYSSDRNRTVEREQRASQTNVVPRSRTDKTQPKTSNLKPRLGNLGVSLPRAPKSTQELEAEKQDPENVGDQALLDKDLPVGSENLLNTQESVYYSFYSRIYDAIGPVWQSMVRSILYSRKTLPGEYLTLVEIVLTSDGTLREVRRVRGSGIEEFDQAATSSWRKIGRFPNPPHGLLNKDGEVRIGWTFAVQISEGMQFRYLPPERVY